VVHLAELRSSVETWRAPSGSTLSEPLAAPRTNPTITIARTTRPAAASGLKVRFQLIPKRRVVVWSITRRVTSTASSHEGHVIVNMCGNDGGGSSGKPNQASKYWAWLTSWPQAQVAVQVY